MQYNTHFEFISYRESYAIAFEMAAQIKRIGNNTEIDQLLNKTFISVGRDGYVEAGEAKICLPVYYENYEERIRKFEVRDDDVFIIAHPKTGTTWLQEMVWLIVNNLDFEGAKQEIVLRSPQLELAALFDIKERFGYDVDLFGMMVEQESPRIIKSHLHWSLLPEQIRNGSKQPKIITVLRSAEDTCVSLYHHSKLVDGYNGNFEDFCKLFLGGRVCFGPFWKQVLSCWEQKDKPNILFLKYKEMKEDMPTVLKRVAEFLGKTLTQEKIEKLTEHLGFATMKNNSYVNHKEMFTKIKEMGLTNEDGEFVRSGTVGGHKNVMSPELIEEFRKWTEENIKGTGLILE